MAAQTSDTVLITLGEGVVEVRQRLAPEDHTVRAFALRFEDQTLEVDEVVREGQSLLDAALRPGPHAYELTVESGAPVVLRYSLRGALDRIPVFVAGGRAELAVARGVETPYLIRVEGSPASLSALDLRTSLPRLKETGDAAEVALASLPSIVRLSRRGGISFVRIADIVALVFIGLGALVAVRQTRRGPRGEAPGQARGPGAEEGS